jgi:hypothetical protein
LAPDRNPLAQIPVGEIPEGGRFAAAQSLIHINLSAERR